MNYKPSHYDNKTYLPLKLIRIATEEGWLDSLCYYVWLRKVHRKPIFYNYSLRKISASLKCSPTTLSVHLKRLQQRGLISVINGNLILKGITKLKTEYKSILVPVMVAHNKADQITALRFVNIKRKLHNEDKAIQKKKDIINLHTKKFTPYKEAKRLLKKERELRRRGIDVETSINDSLVLSNANVAELCSRSIRTAVKIQKALNKLNLVKTFKNTQLTDTGHNRRSFFEKYWQNTGKYRLGSTGNVYEVLPNKWVIGGASSSMQ